MCASAAAPKTLRAKPKRLLSRPALHPVALAAHIAIAATLATGFADTAQAQASQQQAQVNIPAVPLADALNRFAAQAGVALVMEAGELRGLQSPGLSGNYGVEQGFQVLLQGSGYTVERTDSGFVLRRLGTANGASPASRPIDVLPAVVVTAPVEDPVTEGTGSYAGPTTTSSATGLPLSIRETPQTVTVVTQQQMRDQGTSSIADVMQNAAGINAERLDSERWAFSSRGFIITNFMHDGSPRLYDGIYDWGATNLDMVFYDRVEVVKGATGLLSGTGLPSANVNFVRKRPAKEFAGSIGAELGSWSHRRVEADVSTPLNESKSVRARVAAAHQDKESMQDHYQQKLSAVYGIVEADVAPSTRVTVGADWQRVDPRGSTWTGTPVFFSDGSRTDFSRSFNPATDWSRRQFTNNSVFAMLDHRLTSDWRLKVEANHSRSRHHSTLASASGGYPDPVSGEGMYLFSGDFKGEREQNTIHASLTGRYTLWNRRHDASFGASWTDARTDGPTFEGSYPMLTGSIFDWNGSYPETPFEQIGGYAERNRQLGLYASTRLFPTDRLAVILGARANRVQLRRHDYYTNGADDYASAQKENAISPYAGVVFELDGVHALYASYTSIFEPQSLLTMDGDFLDPLEGKAWEAGVKADYLDGQLQASVAVFRIEQDNLPEYAGYVGNNEERYRGVKGVRSQGLELQVAGRITPAWNINASYAYARVRTADGQPVYGSTLMTTQPAHIARAFTTYRLPGAASAWTVGGGLSWQSHFEGKVWPPSETATDYAVVRQSGFALVDLMASFQISRQLTLSANVRNLFDKKYYNSMGLSETAYYGEPRSFNLRMRYEF